MRNYPQNRKGFIKDNAAMSHAEIAEALGVTEQCIQMTEKRALRKLRALRPELLHILEQYWHDMPA